jgi:hypothetical protein
MHPAFADYEMRMVLASILPRVDARLATDRIRVARRGVLHSVWGFADRRHASVARRERAKGGMM